MYVSAPPDLAVILARLEVKLDQLLSASNDHEARLRKLEERRWPLPVVAVVCSGLSLIGTAAGIWMAP